MAFTIGNHVIDEILFAVNESSDGELLYTLDQLQNASIEISAESTDITDKKGNLVRTIYKSKSGTFNSTHAFLHPAVMNAGSGSEIQKASVSEPIEMPAYAIVDTGKTVDLTNAVAGSVKAVARSGKGADVKVFTDVEIAAATVGGVFTAPEVDGATVVFVEYTQMYSGGIRLVNDAEKFPTTTVLKLFCAYVDPCEDDKKLCVVRIPKFMADPNMTISLDSESQEIDYNGTIAMDYCSGSEKILYEIYYPDNAAVVPVVSA